MDIGMYGSDHYQVGEMASSSSAYNYYPNYHNHSHLHHHHMHHNPTAEILSGFSAQSHAPNQTAPVINPTNMNMYHEYGITMSNNEHNFYDTDSNMVQSYYSNQSNPGDHHGMSSSASHQTTPTSASSSSNDVLPEPAPTTHIISSDNGLSYTNLDYMYSSGHPNALYLHQPDDKSAIAHAYSSTSQTANIETSIHSQSHSVGWQSQHPPQHSNHPHHTSGYLENTVNAHGHPVGVNSAACIQNQSALSGNPNGIHPRTINNRTDPANSQQSPQNQPQHGQTVQTYKWMQVKRNVPKPQGNVIIY